MNNPDTNPLDTGYFADFGEHLCVEDDRFDSECGTVRHNPRTLRTRITDRPGGYEPYVGLVTDVRKGAAVHGEIAVRRLLVRLARGMMMTHHREVYGYDAVDALIKGAEDALENGRTSYNFDRALGEHRDEILSAGLSGWTFPGDHKYGAPPLLAAAMLLDEDVWSTLRSVYDLAEWLTCVVDEGYWKHLDAPADPRDIVTAFLSDPLSYLEAL